MLGKKAGYHQRIGAARHQHGQLALTQAGADGGGTLGVGGSREQVQLVLLEKGRKVGAVQQDGDFNFRQLFPHGVHQLGRGKSAVIAKAVFGFGAAAGGGDLRHQRAAAELPPQQRKIAAQMLGKGVLRPAQIALAQRSTHAAPGHILRGKHDRPGKALDKQKRHTVA